MVDRVRDGDPAVRQQREPLGLAEADLVRPAVDEPALAGTDVPTNRLAVRVQLDQPVPGGVGDQEAAVCQGQRLAREAQMGRHRLRGDVRAVAAPQRALGRVLRLQLLDQLLDGVRVSLARVLGDDVPLGVDHDQRGPGPHRVLLPGGQLRVVQDGVVHLVALHGVHDRLVLRLVHELGRVDADDHHGVAVLLLQLAQLVQDVQTVHTAEGPEVQDDDASPQVGEGVGAVTGVEPAALADQFGGADACTCCHATSQPHRDLPAFRRGIREPVTHETSRTRAYVRHR